jgi:hypothetical protein
MAESASVCVAQSRIRDHQCSFRRTHFSVPTLLLCCTAILPYTPYRNKKKGGRDIIKSITLTSISKFKRA